MNSFPLKGKLLSHSDKLIVTWLLLVAFCVLMMVFIGGVTRLTDSGLSIVEWKPVTGIIFPLTESSWLVEFAKYKLSPEFLKLNSDMTLSEYKFIYFLEYFHRLFGRLTGVVFFVPLVYFMIKKSIKKPLAINLIIIGILGAIQGFVGWYMVSSGLKDSPYVSHYRLTFHLGMAVTILAMILWQVFNIVNVKVKVPISFHRYVLALTIMIFAQILLGGLVAGLDAGLIYSDFPYMGDGFVPQEIYNLNSIWQVFSDPASIQFIHRVLGLTIGIFIIYLQYLTNVFNLSKKINISGKVLLFLVTLQIMLGILTLWWQVPVNTASAHQVVAVLLLSTSLYLQHCCKAIK